MNEPTMFKAQGCGIELQLARWGGGAKTILCIHGMTANCRCWDRLMPVLADRHRVLAVDLRGRGGSDKPQHGYSLNHHVKDMQALLQDLALPRAIVLGHSLGAYVGVLLAALYPAAVEKLILLDGGGQLSPKRWDRIEQVIKPSLDRLNNTFPSLEAYVQPLQQAAIFQPWSEYHDTYFRYDIQNVAGGVRSRIDPQNIRREIADLRTSDVSGLYGDIACDVLILRATQGVAGQEDLLLPPHAVDAMLRSIPNARQQAVDGSNHFSILFNPHAERDKAMASFLNDCG